MPDARFGNGHRSPMPMMYEAAQRPAANHRGATIVDRLSNSSFSQFFVRIDQIIESKRSIVLRVAGVGSSEHEHISICKSLPAKSLLSTHA